MRCTDWHRFSARAIGARPEQAGRWQPACDGYDEGVSEGRPNRLAQETSPYLLQHSRNPVDWYPWGEEALARAREEDKPIFLSIGYAACHWCHVMERESFEDEETAAQLNRGFVAIKVDREERPEIDQLYMGAVVAMTGGGGWPMSVFLTPDGQPFFGGTYFPSEARHGLPSFRQVLEGVDRAWKEQRAEVQQAGARIVEALVAQSAPPAIGIIPDQSTLEAAVEGLRATFDSANGGWGQAPKFPQPMAIDFLLRRAAAGPGATSPGAIVDTRALAIARRSLDAMAAGGIHDQLGGGFHRYAVDAHWLVPHFEKMLYDNAQLARVYVHAWQLTQERAYLEVASSTLDYLAREMRTADGAFAASQDADTDGVEGATYTWRAGEVAAALESAGMPEAGPPLGLAYGVTEAGNWEGSTILARVRNDLEVASAFGLDPAGTAEMLDRARAALKTARDARPQPARDDKVLAAWNGLAIAAFADAARALAASGETKPAAMYREIAVTAAEAVLAGLRGPDGRLARSWKDGRRTGSGILEDHADLAEGLLALYEATLDEQWFVEARRLADEMLARFRHPGGGFYDTADDHEALVARPRDVQDNAMPSGGSMAATVLLRIAALTGEGAFRSAAEEAIRGVAAHLASHPSAFAQWLIAADFALSPAVEVAVVGDPWAVETRRLLAPALSGFRPHQVLAVGPDPSATAVPLLGGRFALDGRPTAFVCRNFACRQPVTEPEALATLLTEDWERPGIILPA
jgi:hypothetical protein